ncbi:MAG: tyrosine-type recombinase/integrase [Fibromonadaceae bacterium]|jgi:site-specific recombinase XerD|nr:tyrosine-type recombinase/integrase [Fibromonadaceae bacterium]
MSETYLLPQQRNKSKGSKIWHGGIVKNGVTRWISLKTKDEKVAMKWFAKMQASLYAPPKEEQQPSRIKLRDAVEAYLADVEKVRRRAKGTVREYKKHLHCFSSWCYSKGIADISEITPLICSEYARDSLAKMSGSSAKAKIVFLRSFLRWTAQIHSINMQNPFMGISLSKPKPEPRKFWTVEECEKIIENATSEEKKCWFALMAYAGLRKEEARLLKMEDIEGFKISVVGKGGKAATIPISMRLKEYLNQYLISRGDEPGYLFPALAKLNHTNLERFVRKAALKAMVSNADTAHYHRFRHSFASNLLRKGRSIKAVQMLMRHENVTLTLNIYGHLLPSDLEKEVEL